MASRTISSPGVQINEVDLSLIARPSGETNVFITGFAAQGPTDEIINVTSVSEFETIFGLPTNAAERYLYHSARQLLTTSPANLLVTRLPYGENLGDGFSNKRSALVFPIKAEDKVMVAALSSVNNVIALSGGYPIYLGYDVESLSEKMFSTQNSVNAVYNNTIVSVITSYTQSTSAVSYEDAEVYTVMEPKSIVITDADYQKLVTNDVAWTSAYNTSAISGFSQLGYGGLVVVNDAKTTINNIYQGYYIGFSDNSGVNPSTNFDSITGVRSYTGISGDVQTFVTVPNNRFNFALSGTANSLFNNSISEIIESAPIGYDFSSELFNDYLTSMIFKLRPSIYQQDTVTLDYVVTESNTGSLYSLRKLNTQNGGSASTSFLDNVVNTTSNNIRIITNPYISQIGNWITDDGKPRKRVRISKGAKNLYGIGVYVSDTDKNSKVVDNVPNKLERALRCIENDDTLVVDVIAECGLGTIWASAKSRKLNSNFSSQPLIFDDLYNLDITNGGVANTGLKDTTGSDPACTARDEYLKVINQFYAFADKTRKDHVFISDPLRSIFVQGSNTKLSKNKSFVFSNDIYWPLKNLYSSVESSYIATYANWIRTNDNSSDTLCWIPASGYVASVYATSAQVAYPWSAPAGFNRGKLVNVIDLAINPTQKQRDLLYKININPIAFFVNDGNVIFGQKTLFRKPSAFDRVNVRRLFLTLEKTTKDILKLFIFEPNSFTTRNRVVGALTPLFDDARLNDGLYDYTIVCDERNNPPSTIDNNEMRVSIYIQPVRTAEFILADFIATRTGVNFEELIS